MGIVSDSHKPLYAQIADDILSGIRSGKLRPGDKLPSEAELSGRYSVSRVTVRHALSLLSHSNVITTYQGKGCFVNAPVFERPLTQTSEMLSFSQLCTEGGREPGARLVKIDYVTPTSNENHFLRQPQGCQLLRIQRIRTADAVPVFLENSLFPQRGFEFLLEGRLDDESINHLLLTELGRSVANYSRCTIKVCTADTSMARLLSIAAGDPLFREEKNVIDADGEPLFVAVDYLVGSCFEFEM